jgi:hypothetical protein
LTIISMVQVYNPYILLSSYLIGHTECQVPTGTMPSYHGGNSPLALCINESVNSFGRHSGPKNAWPDCAICQVSIVDS